MELRHGRKDAEVRRHAAGHAGQARGGRAPRATSTRSTRDYAREKAAEQAARCSQCGVPFCQIHCPLHNNIPDWLKLTAEGRLRGGLRALLGDQQLPRDLRPHLPAGPAVRRQLRHREGLRRGHHRLGREVHHRHRLGAGLGASRSEPRRERRRERRHRRRRPGRPRRGRAAAPQGLPGHGLRPLRPRRRPADLRHPQLQAREGRRAAPRRSCCATAASHFHLELRGRRRRHAGRAARAPRRGADRHRRLQGARHRGARRRPARHRRRRSTISPPPTARAWATRCRTSTPARSTPRASTSW